jgi:hypothetical protein
VKLGISWPSLAPQVSAKEAASASVAALPGGKSHIGTYAAVASCCERPGCIRVVGPRNLAVGSLGDTSGASALVEHFNPRWDRVFLASFLQKELVAQPEYQA